MFTTKKLVKSKKCLSKRDRLSDTDQRMFHSITTNNSKAPLLRGFATTFSLKSCFPFSYWLPLCSNESFLWSGVSAITSTVLYVNSRSPCSHTFLYLVRTEMIQEITLSETKPSGSNFHTLLDIRNCIVINSFNAKLHPQYPWVQFCINQYSNVSPLSGISRTSILYKCTFLFCFPQIF